MAKIIIKDVPPFDGTYDLNIAALNGRELHLIKQISGVRAGELTEALAAGDYDLVVAFTVIGLRRAGVTVDPEQIMEADIGSITVDLDEEVEVEERPPGSPPPNGSESSDGDKTSSDVSTGSSGEPSSSSGVPPASLPSLIGLPGSADRVGSAQETWAN